MSSVGSLSAYISSCDVLRISLRVRYYIWLSFALSRTGWLDLNLHPDVRWSTCHLVTILVPTRQLLGFHLAKGSSTSHDLTQSTEYQRLIALIHVNCVIIYFKHLCINPKLKLSHGSPHSWTQSNGDISSIRNFINTLHVDLPSSVRLVAKCGDCEVHDSAKSVGDPSGCKLFNPCQGPSLM